MSVDNDVAQLEELSLADLRSKWSHLVGTPAPKIGTNMLRLALAWEIQASGKGGLPRGISQQLDQLARGRTRSSVPRPGTRLVRAWNGKLHIVEIGEDAVIRWDGRSWRSLSEVARAITGTRWSGPAFFGLKKKIAP